MDRDLLRDVEWRRRQREALFDPGTVHWLDRIGVAEGWRCLEIGAGYGSIAAWLASRTGPDRVTATDIRGEYLLRLRECLEGAATVMEHDVSADPLPSGEFDLVHARFVLEHLPARETIITKLVDALRPGGWLVIEDAEFSPCVADGSAYGDAMSAFVAAMTRSGTDYSWALQLPEVLSRANVRLCEAVGQALFFAGASDEAKFWAANWFDVRDALTSVGLSEAALEAAVAEADDSRRWFPGPMVVTAAARRPD